MIHIVKIWLCNMAKFGPAGSFQTARFIGPEIRRCRDIIRMVAQPVGLSAVQDPF